MNEYKTKMENRLNKITLKKQKSKRKTVSIFIERDGSVSARMPEKLNDAEIKEILKAKEYQIFKNLLFFSLV